MNETDGKQRIVAAAQPLFVAYGYKGVSMQQIADASNIHKATLYHHFRDKDALFLMVVQRELEAMRAEMVQAIDQESSIEPRLRALAWNYLQRTHGAFGQFMSDAHTHLPEAARREITQIQAFPWEQLEGIFREASAAGDLPEVDGRLAATMFAGLVWGQTWARKTGRETDPATEELAGRLVDILLAGLTHSPAAREPAMPLALA